MALSVRHLFILTALIATGAHAQDASPDPIDVQLDHCLQDTTGETTAGMRECVFLAYQAWDAELNKVYNELMGQLSPESQKALRASQRAWLAFRDAQFKLNNRIYFEELQGTMYYVTAGSCNMDLVKRRVNAPSNP